MIDGTSTTTYTEWLYGPNSDIAPLGYRALTDNPGNWNTFIGTTAGINSTGNDVFSVSDLIFSELPKIQEDWDPDSNI